MNNYEEKAKAYDEAIEVARTLLDTRCVEGTNGYFHRKDIEQMFPILAESEDEKIRKAIIRCVVGNMPDNDYRKKYLAWLEKQKDTLKDTLKDIEQKPEWSEEDEGMHARIVRSYTSYERSILDARDLSEDHRNNILKDLNEQELWIKDRLKFLRPQKQWKPSEEQIKALEGCVDYLNESDNEDLLVMESLLEQLKALV